MTPEQIAAADQREAIYRAMDSLEQIPQGGVGPLGATMAEIDEAERSGHVVDDDATYHNVQKAWRYLQEALP